MFNRREFIGAGAAALPLAGVAGLAGAVSTTPPIYTAVLDGRFADSVAFGREARRLGLRTSAVRGDVTDLWYNDLYHRWRKEPAAIAGLTTATTFLCLETLAVDAGLRRVLHVEHRSSEGSVTHHMDGPGRLLRDAALEASGGAWSRRMAQLIARCLASRADSLETTASSAASALGAQTLVSWVMAPLGGA